MPPPRDDRPAFLSRVLIDGRLLCVSQVLGGHLVCLPAHADDGLGAVCGRLCEEAGARERAEAARGDTFKTPQILALLQTLRNKKII